MQACQIFFPRQGEVDFETVELPEADAGQLENPHLSVMEGYEVVIEASGVPEAAPQAYQRLWSRQEALVTIALDWTS